MDIPGSGRSDALAAEILELLRVVERQLEVIIEKADRILASSSNGAATPHA